MSEKSKWIPVGKVLKPHGLKSTLKVSYQSKSLLSEEQIIQIKNNDYTVKQFRANGQFYLLDLEEINTIDDAESLRDAEIFINNECLAEDEYSIEHLEGLSALDHESKEIIGEVIAVENLPSQPVLKIQRNNKQEILYIPFVEPNYIKKIDLETNQILIADWELFIL